MNNYNPILKWLVIALIAFLFGAPILAIVSFIFVRYLFPFIAVCLIVLIICAIMKD